ncbi:MAG TPA: cobyric acid synthase, partial [Acidimicrobiales bacterium]|nr:cobyric acid synthase [Acidimicrobiales bacterium]
QAMQAMAAGIEPEVAMNPVLLKPTGERRSQVVVMGRPTGEAGAVDYQATKAALRPQVLQALADLRARFDVVICEGAGSPAEINLLDNDIVNLGLAAAAGVRAIIVGDIERGGVFASLYGTIELLPQELRRCVKGFVINKLRGDPSLLTPGIEELEQRTGVPCLGVIPWIDGLVLDAEDSLALARLGSRGGVGNETVTNAIDVAVVRLPRISNFTDLDALSLEPAVGLRLVTDPAELGDPDLILIPGSKTTVLDLQWLHDSGLAAAIRRAADEPEGPVVLGVCAGYQMLGASIEDSVESGAGVVEGLGLLGGKTVFGDEKVTRLRRGTSLGHPVTGYEIRHGTPASPKGTAWIDLDGPGPEQQPEPEGERRPDGRVYGTSLHGLFEADAFRSAFLAEVAGRRGKQFSPDGISFEAARQAQFDRVADLVEEHVDLDRLWRIVQSAPAPAHRKDPA